MQLASVGRQAFTKFLRQNPLMFSSSPSSGGQGQPNSNPKLNMCSTKIVNSHPPQLLQSQSLLHEESHNNNPIENNSHNNFSSQVLSLNTRKLSRKGDPKAPLNLLQGQVLSYFRPFQSRDLSNLLKYNRGGAVFSNPQGEAIERNIPTTLSTRNVHMLTLGKINDEDKTFETVTLAEMKRFFRKYEIPFEDGYTCLRVDCFFCKKATRKKKSFFWDSDKLYVNKTTGYFVCINCKISGTWKNLQDLIILFKSGQGFTKTSLDHLKKDEPISKFEEKLNDLQMNSQEISTLTSEEWSEIALRFGLEKLKKPVLEQYEMRYNKDEDYILLPIYNVELKRIGYQIFKISSKTGVLEANTVPKSCKEIFGWKPVIQTISSNSVAKSKPIILVQSALDALSVASGSTYLPLGLHPDCNHLPQEFLPQLEHFNDIILWFGNDVKSWESAKAFGRKLEEKRCKLLRPMDLNPSPFLALQQDLNLNKILTAAQPMEHKAITTFSKLRDEVLSELNHQDQVAGVKWTRFPYLTKLLKGHRRGELTVLTGSTGSGKTTFVSEYSLDLCIHGVNTLWGSFEIRNVRLAKTMLTQFSETNLETHIDEYDKWADKFEKLPLYFMTFHGQQSVKAVLDAMTHAAYVYDIGHVVVDNLQFMLGVSEGSGHLDRFWRQDLIVAAFRKFATVNNCHVTLVMHPRKEGTDTELSNSSIFGGAKASQEADNILILQDKRLTSPRGKKYLQVSKNRFSGDLGMFTLEFNRECLSFATKKKPRSDQSIIVKHVTDNNDDRKDSSEINDHDSSKISDHMS